MNDAPSSNGDNRPGGADHGGSGGGAERGGAGDGGRGPGGRFAKGNGGGPGNPYAQRVATLRAALFDACTPQDLSAIVRALVASALGGDVPAAKELLQRLLGPADAVDALERIEQIEKRLEAMQRGGGR